MYIDVVQKIDRIIWVEMNLNTTFLLFRSWYVSRSPRSSKVAVCFGLFFAAPSFPIIFLIAAGWGCRYVLLKDYVKSAKVGGVWDMDQLISNGMPGALGGNQLELIHGHLTQNFLSQSHECSDWRVGELPMFFCSFERFFFVRAWLNWSLFQQAHGTRLLDSMACCLLWGAWAVGILGHIWSWRQMMSYGYKWFTSSMTRIISIECLIIPPPLFVYGWKTANPGPSEYSGFLRYKNCDPNRHCLEGALEEGWYHRMWRV